MKAKDNVATMPSFYMEQAISILKLEKSIEPERIRKLERKADAFHAKHCPGNPNITMAAFLSMALPIVNRKGNFMVARTGREIAKAFDCSENAMRERKTRIRTEG